MSQLCRHCHREPVSRPRGLGHRCYYAPGVRDLYPTDSPFHRWRDDPARPWYTNGDGTVIIPRHQFSGALVQACDSAPAGARFDQEQLRCLLQIGDFHTDRRPSHAVVWERFILPTDGKGNKLSNQRRLTRSMVLEDFVAEGEINFDPADVKEKSVRDLLRYAGKYVGVGASRKMGYGRFTIEE